MLRRKLRVAVNHDVGLQFARVLRFVGRRSRLSMPVPRRPSVPEVWKPKSPLSLLELVEEVCVELARSFTLKQAKGEAYVISKIDDKMQ